VENAELEKKIVEKVIEERQKSNPEAITRKTLPFLASYYMNQHLKAATKKH